MSPRDLSSSTITARLRLLRELLDDLDLLGEITEGLLETDRIRRRALERILTQLVDLAADINQHIASSQTDRAPSDYRDSFDAVADLGVISHDLAQRLGDAVGLRNVLVHRYINARMSIVAESAPMARQDFADYIGSVADWLS